MPIIKVKIFLIQGITAPVANEIPVSTIKDNAEYTGTVSWFPDDSPFKENTEYTAIIKLTAKKNFTFSGIPENFFKVDGAQAVNSPSSGSVAAVFPKTGGSIVEVTIIINEQPESETIVTFGNINVSLNIEAIASDGRNLDYQWYSSLTANNSGGTIINGKTNAGFVIPEDLNVGNYYYYCEISANELDSVFSDVAEVIVQKAAGNFGSPAVINITYIPALSLENIKSSLQAGYSWDDESTLLGGAGNGKTFPATYIHSSGNYEAATGSITVNVAKAEGLAVGTPEMASVTTSGITINAVSAPENGQSAEYNISTENDETDFMLSEWQTELSFSGLFSGTIYYIYARSAENANYTAGSASVSSSIMTKQESSGKIIAYYWLDEHDQLASSGNGLFTVSPGDTLTIRALNEDFDNYQWHLNGNIVSSGVTEYEYEFSSWVTGKYVLGLFVEKNSGFYNTNFTITVAEE